MKTYLIRLQKDDPYHLSSSPPEGKAYKVREYDSLEEAVSKMEGFNAHLVESPTTLNAMLDDIGPTECSRACDRRVEDGSRFLKKGLRPRIEQLEQIAKHGGYRIRVERF